MLCHRPLINRSDTREQLVIPYDHVLGYAIYRKVLFDTDMLIFINICINSQIRITTHPTIRQPTANLLSLRARSNSQSITISLLYSFCFRDIYLSALAYVLASIITLQCKVCAQFSLFTPCHMPHSSLLINKIPAVVISFTNYSLSKIKSFN